MAVGDGGRSDTDAESSGDLARIQGQVEAAEGDVAQARPDIDGAEAVDPGNQH